MYVNYEDKDCCAIAEISGLASERSPETAIKKILRDLNKTSYYSSYFYDDEDKSDRKPAGIYLFSEVTNANNSDKLKVGYGKKFAAYIRRAKLGAVVASHAASNHRNHPDHNVRAYLWTPNLTTLRKWAEKRNIKTHF